MNKKLSSKWNFSDMRQDTPFKIAREYEIYDENYVLQAYRKRSNKLFGAYLRKHYCVASPNYWNMNERMNV